MMMMRWLRVAALVAMPLPFASRAAGQLANERVGAGAAFERYDFGDPASIGIESITLMTVPFGARFDVSRAFTLQVSGNWARAALNNDRGQELTIDGLTDTEVRATLGLRDRMFTLTAVAMLPTGHATLTDAEAEVAGVIGADVLPFRITNWGTGGGFGASIAAAVPLGAFAAGISAGYVVAREFEPIDADEDFVYRPGDQLHVTAAIDRDIGLTAKLSLRVGFQRFATDEANGANLYQAGNRYHFMGSWAFAAGARASAILYGGYLHRAEGRFEVQPEVRPAQNQILAGGGLRFPLGRGILQPTVDLRVLTGTDDADSGYTAGVGASAEWPLDDLTLVPMVRGRFGHAQGRQGGESSFTGVDAGLMIRFGTR